MIANSNISLILSTILATILLGCSNNGGASTSGNVIPVGATLITIDSTGVVPIIGNSTSTSVVYVHNNSNVVISGISYVAQNNSGGGNFLDSNSTQACSTIPVGQSCPLTFTTPTIINSASAQGSTSITASYSVKNYNNGKTNTFNQIIRLCLMQVPQVPFLIPASC